MKSLLPVEDEDLLIDRFYDCVICKFYLPLCNCCKQEKLYVLRFSTIKKIHSPRKKFYHRPSLGTQIKQLSKHNYTVAIT